MIIEVSFDNHDSFYSLKDDRIAELAVLPLGEMVPFVVENGELFRISSTEEVDVIIVEDVSCYDEVDEEELREELLELVG